MAGGLLDNFGTALQPLLAKAAGEMFSGGDGIRWEGLSIGELRSQIEQLMSGSGDLAMMQAVDDLATVANNLGTLDQTLYDQLQVIGANWLGTAGDLVYGMSAAAAAYGSTAGETADSISAAAAATARAYAAALNKAPDPTALTPPPASTLPGPPGGIANHGDDHAKQAAVAAAARQRAIDAMRGYQTSAQAILSSHQPLPAPPKMGQAAPSTPASSPVTMVSDFIPPSSGAHGTGGASNPSGSGGAPGAGGTSGFPGSGSIAPRLGPPTSRGVPATGGAPGGGGLAGGGGGSAGGSSGGVPTAGGLPGLPGDGGRSGVPGIGGPGDGRPPAPSAPPPAQPPFSRTGQPNPAGPIGGSAVAGSVESGGASSAWVEDATLAGTAMLGGAAGAGIGAAASARKHRLVRGPDLVNESGPAELGGDGFGARRLAARALAELEGEKAYAAELSWPHSRPSGIDEAPTAALEPVQRNWHDGPWHTNRHHTQEDLFGDPRTVVPPVLDGWGDESDPDDPAESR